MAFVSSTLYNLTNVLINELTRSFHICLFGGVLAILFLPPARSWASCTFWLFTPATSETLLCSWHEQTFPDRCSFPRITRELEALSLLFPALCHLLFSLFHLSLNSPRVLSISHSCLLSSLQKSPLKITLQSDCSLGPWGTLSSAYSSCTWKAGIK